MKQRFIQRKLYRFRSILHLGLSVEAKVCNASGYNYKSSEWYENYSIFNKDYEISNKIGKKQKEK